MTDRFRFDFEWLSAGDFHSDERASFADLSIVVDSEIVTEVEDLLAKTVRHFIRVSAAPVAQWLAINWWRLRWEPLRATLAWRMSHQLGAAGGGYAWPNLIFCGDGDFLLVESRPTSAGPGAPVRYLNTFGAWVPLAEFERTVDDFMEAVGERLTFLERSDSPIRGLWIEVCAERQDPAQAEWRKLEALLGFDPDEAPEDLVVGLQGQFVEAGQSAVEEIAAAAQVDAMEQLGILMNGARDHAIPIQIPDSDALRPEIESIDRRWLPWQRAEVAARRVRKRWGLEPGPIRDQVLADLLSLSGRFLSDKGDRLPFPAGYRTDDDRTIKIVMNRKPPTGRRFALARLVADHLYAGQGDHLLPVTTAKTARQTFQRAFAQELLCPWSDLIAFLDSEEPDEEDIEDAADYFSVSPLLVKAALVDRGQLNRERLVGRSLVFELLI